ncbi:MAG: hypothetical protein ACOH1J_09205 [Microbacteriaceae bacterium]
MSDAQADGVLDEADGNMRMALMGASQLAQAATRARTESHERASRRDLEVARQLQGRLEAERVGARAELAPVHQASWWDQANTHDVARAYETAVTFRGENQAARDAESRIRQELRDRYSIDVNESGADPSVVQASLAEFGSERSDGEQERDMARDERDIAAELTVGAEALELGADLEEAQDTAMLRELASNVEHDAEVVWDSSERREAHVAGIDPGDGQSVAAAAWKQADVDQARHPREAVRSGKTRFSKSRVPSSTPGKQIERDSR